MSWFKVDDHAAFNAKVLRAGNEAFGAWTRAGSWTSAAGKDGFIPDETADLIAKKKVWEKAESAGLMTRVDGGWAIHNYLKYNPSAEDVASKREARAQAGALGGRRSVEAKAQANAQAIASADAQAVASHTFQPPSRPVPSRPNPSKKPTVSSDLVDQVFGPWADENQRRTGRRPLLTDARKARIRARIAEGKNVADLILACRGVWLDTWHTERRKTELEYVLRDDANVLRFIAIAEAHDAAKRPQMFTASPPEPVYDGPSVSDEELAAATDLFAHLGAA